MKANLEYLLQNYNKEQNFGIPCTIENNPNLTKLLTGAGSKVARSLFTDYISFDLSLEPEAQYKIFEIAKQINKNPDVAFFTCVASGDMKSIHIEFWGEEELLTAAKLLEGCGEALLSMLTNKN